MILDEMPADVLAEYEAELRRDPDRILLHGMLAVQDRIRAEAFQALGVMIDGRSVVRAALVLISRIVMDCPDAAIRAAVIAEAKRLLGDCHSAMEAERLAESPIAQSRPN